MSQTAVDLKEAKAIAREVYLRDRRAALQHFMRVTNLTPEDMATALHLPGGGNRGTFITRYLNGGEGYKGLDEAVGEFLKICNTEVKPFANLGIVANVCDHARRRGVINGIPSRSGYGKTIGLLAYARARGAIYYSHDKVSSRRDALIELARQAGLRQVMQARAGNIRRRLAARLKELGSPLLLIDEADTCPFGFLETVRGIHDEVGCGMVLAGMEKWLEELLLKDSRGRRPEQLVGRVAAITPLHPPSPDEIAMIAADYGVSGARAIDLLHRSAIVLGGFRRVKMILDDAEDIRVDIGANSITLSILEQAVQYLPGGRKGEQ